MKIKVMLVDDQNLVRKGIRSLLELSEEIEVVAEARDGTEAIDMLAEVNPDVMLLDMRMPGLSGVDVLRRLSAKMQGLYRNAHFMVAAISAERHHRMRIANQRCTN